MWPLKPTPPPRRHHPQWVPMESQPLAEPLEAVKLAMASNVKQLALYSHDPDRTDDDIDKVVAHCQEYIEIAESPLGLFAAAEGQTLDL